MPGIHQFKRNFIDRLSKKPFLIWLLQTPPYHKFVAITLPIVVIIIVNRSFSDINVSQVSVTTYARSGGIVINHLMANLPRNVPVKNWKSIKIWQNYGHEFVASLFLYFSTRHNYTVEWTGQCTVQSLNDVDWSSSMTTCRTAASTASRSHGNG